MIQCCDKRVTDPYPLELVCTDVRLLAEYIQTDDWMQHGMGVILVSRESIHCFSRRYAPKRFSHLRPSDLDLRPCNFITALSVTADMCNLSSKFELFRMLFRFYRAMHMHKRGRLYAVTRCPSACLSVTFRSCTKTNKDIFEMFSPSGSDTILVFPYQRGCRYSDGNSPNRGVE